MTAPRVTVLMPVFNGVQYLAEAIQSVLQQTFTDFEFLIIDDGSTDNSLAVIRGFDDLRIRLVSNENNLGLVATLNMGLNFATGEYIARMDQDDICRSDRLSKQVNFMDENLNVGVCGSWVRVISRSNNYIWKLPGRSEEIRSWLFTAVGVAHPSVMIRRQLFIKNELFYDPMFKYIEDYELWVRAIQHMDFANIEEPLLDYRISPGQMCARYSAEQLVAVAPLRLQRVRELGVEPSQAEQQLHEMIMNGTVPHDSAYLDRAEQWLKLLDCANRSVGVYSVDSFSRRILDIWFSTCLRLADTSVCSWWRCLYSPLWSGTNASTWSRLRAFGAWTLRRGLRWRHV